MSKLNFKLTPETGFTILGFGLAIAQYMYGAKKETSGRDQLKGELKTEVFKEVMEELQKKTNKGS